MGVIEAMTSTIKIKSLKVYKLEEGEQDPVMHLHREYDENGNKLKEISYSADENLVEEKTFIYDNSGKLLEEISHYAEDEVTEIMRYEYDESNRMLKTHKSYGEEGEADTTTFTYATSGKLVEKRTVSSEGELEQLERWIYKDETVEEYILSDDVGRILDSSKFTYNKKAEAIEELRYSAETEKEVKILYDHLVSGKMPDSTIYTREGKIVQRTRHTFDEKQRVIKEVTETVNNGVKKVTAEYDYDENNNLIETRLVDKNENLISKSVYKHNTHNLPIEEIHYEEVALGVEMRQTITITEYEFY